MALIEHELHEAFAEEAGPTEHENFHASRIDQECVDREIKI